MATTAVPVDAGLAQSIQRISQGQGTTEDIIAVLTAATRGDPQALEAMSYIYNDPKVQQWDSDKNMPGIQFQGKTVPYMPGDQASQAGRGSGAPSLPEYNPSTDQNRREIAAQGSRGQSISQANQSGAVQGMPVQGNAQSPSMGQSAVPDTTFNGGNGPSATNNASTIPSAQGTWYEGLGGINGEGYTTLADDPDLFVDQYLQNALGIDNYAYQGSLSKRATALDALYGLFNPAGGPNGAAQADVGSRLNWRTNQLNGSMSNGSAFDPNAMWAQLFSPGVMNDPAMNGSYIAGTGQDTADTQYKAVLNLIQSAADMGANPSYINSMASAVSNAYRDYQAATLRGQTTGSFIEYMKSIGLQDMFD